MQRCRRAYILTPPFSNITSLSNNNFLLLGLCKIVFYED